MFVTKDEILKSGQSCPVFLHARFGQVCPVCRAVVLGEKGWHDEDMEAHLAWHKEAQR